MTDTHYTRSGASPPEPEQRHTTTTSPYAAAAGVVAGHPVLAVTLSRSKRPQWHFPACARGTMSAFYRALDDIYALRERALGPADPPTDRP